MKSLRWIVIGSLSLALAGCGVFFAPLQGRWNPADPDRDDGTVLTASMSGYVDSAGYSFFATPTMFAGETNMKMALVRFPTADLPRVVVSAQLELYASYSPAMFFYIVACPILQDWDTSVTYDTVAYTAGFAGNPAGPSVYVDGPGWYYLDVAAALKNGDPAELKGFIIKQEVPYTGAVEFNTHRVAGYAPRLRVYGY